jgi:hypothetical protein
MSTSRSATVVLPEQVPPATPMTNGFVASFRPTGAE